MKDQVLGLLLLTLAACFVATRSTQVCGDTAVWRNNNITCPMRAVCADVFNQVRNWYNGTTCQERRVLYNCICPGNMACPVNDPDHRLYSSRRHENYLCEPKCRLPWCGGIQPRRSPQRGSRLRGGSSRAGARVDPVFAAESLQNDPGFGGRTYVRMGCRCPGHEEPAQGRGVRRAVRAWQHRWNVQTQQYKTVYVCDNRSRNSAMPDPCPAGEESEQQQQQQQVLP